MNLLRELSDYFNLESDRDEFDKIHAAIEKDILFRGTNLWILVFAIFLASVGLNMNSTAVIIGAMLISPLMGPINGIGYSIATYDFHLLRKALVNLGFAVGTSLLTSTIYFTLSPISAAQSELLARTSPTIYDVLIALFGGLAGIVAISSRHKGNVLPGVAIATALMPPLCTAGYGIASREPAFFFGAFYLFTINAVFIALSSVVISQILKFPIRSDIAPERKSRINHIISAVITLTVIPSIYFGYLLVQKEKFNERASRYISQITLYQGNFLIRSDVDPSKERILLVYGGNSLSQEQQEEISRLKDIHGLESATIEIQQGFNSDDRIAKSLETETLKLEISRLNQQLRDQEARAQAVREEQQRGKILLKELTPLFPAVSSCAIASGYRFATSSADGKPVMRCIVGVSNPMSASEKSRISEWLRVRLEKPDLEVIFE